MLWLTESERDAIVYGERHISYKEFAGMIGCASARLAGKCTAGSLVSIIGCNSPNWAAALYGAWSLHAAVVPVDFMSAPEEIAFILGDCRPAVIWCDQANRPKLEKALSLMESGQPEVQALEDISSECSAPLPASYESPDEELAFVIYTSGTTGSPKGVMLTFGNIHANTDACSRQMHLYVPEDRVLVVLPLHHAYPLMGTLVMPIAIGATSVMVTEMNANAIMSVLRKNHCTFILGVPRLLEIFCNSILKQIRASKLATLLYRVSKACRSLWLSRLLFRKVQQAFGGQVRYVACGGAAASAEMVDNYYAFGFELIDGYGMTETAPMISCTPPGHRKSGSPGKPIPCNEIKTADDEVLVRGPNVMKGYWGRPQETSEAVDADGWLHTGDTGYLDPEGFLFLTGRCKELIILGNGKNINPLELENKLMSLADGLFAECAVTDDGRHLTAVVVPEQTKLAGSSLTELKGTIMARVIELYNQAVPSYKHILKLVIAQTALPRTRLGKLRRHIVRQLAAKLAAKEENIQQPEN